MGCKAIWLGVINEEKEALEHLDIWKLNTGERVRGTEMSSQWNRKKTSREIYFLKNQFCLVEDLAETSLPFIYTWGEEKQTPE